MKMLNKYMFKRYRWQRLTLILIVLFCGYIISLWKNRGSSRDIRYPSTLLGYNDGFIKSKRQLLVSGGHDGGYGEIDKSYIPGLNGTEAGGGLWPTELFNIDQLRGGAIILHFFGLIYMFMALSMVCDEFFVPALETIIEVLGISEDVAGATFMAAGGSAPELFTSLIGTLLAKNDVGIGTIVGSAVFNILFVIGMCSFFSPGALELTWWPLFRDVNFYLVSLIFLVIFFLDGKIVLHEALILFGCYLSYVIFMMFNSRVERRVKNLVARCKGKKVEDPKATKTESKNARTERTSIPPLMIYKSRKSIAHLMFEDDRNLPSAIENRPSIKPLSQADGTTVSTASKVNSHLGAHITNNNNVASKSSKVHNPKESALTVSAKENDDSQVQLTSINPEDNSKLTIQGSDELEEEDQQPLDMSWPSGENAMKRRINYLIVFPICFLLWMTVPDVRNEKNRKFFTVSFFMSIAWIGVYSYLMVWWTTTIGIVLGINDAIMGLTILAAGTSIPDLITSVLVAKKGFGDMAVSSSIGSNIFDITVGLPIPWLLYFAFKETSLKVNAEGVACHILLLIMMLIGVVVSIAASGWKLRKSLGVLMMILYAVFVSIAILVTRKFIKCPDLYNL